jgi:thioredoxin-like negative regulator of GroEL
MFYAPWCKQCKEIKPNYHKAATELKSDAFDCHLAAVDCSSNPIVTDKYDISVFPTFKLFLNGKFAADYTGKTTKDDIKQFVAEVKNRENKEL